MEKLSQLDARGGAENPRLVPKYFTSHPYYDITCSIHPVVISQILDAAVNKNRDQQYVIGTLLGSVGRKNVVEIVDCFVDRYSLNNDGLLQIIKDHHEAFHEIKQSVNPQRHVVGWFCTGEDMTELTCAVHTWFKQVNSVSKFTVQPPLVEPIHLLVNSSANNPEGLRIKAHVQVVRELSKDAVFEFHEIPLEIAVDGPDSAVIAMLPQLSALVSPKPPAPPEIKLHESLHSLMRQLEVCQKYVDGVLEGVEEPCPMVGREIHTALSAVMRKSGEDLDDDLISLQQDYLMLVQLSLLGQTQSALADKLTVSFC